MLSPSIHIQHNTIQHGETGRQDWAFKVGGQKGEATRLTHVDAFATFWKRLLWISLSPQSSVVVLQF